MASSTTGMLMLSSTPSSSSFKQYKQTTKAVVIECSSRPQKKATAHHMKTRPKKTQPWDVKRRGPTPYPPLPTLPPDWTLVSSSSEDSEEQQLQKQMMEEEEEMEAEISVV